MTETDTNRELPDETVVLMSEDDYRTEVYESAEQVLHHFANSSGRLSLFHSIDVRYYLNSEGSIHETHPFSVLEHAEHDPSPGAWEWIDDVPPVDALNRQACEMFAGDVEKRAKKMAESEEYATRVDGETYIKSVSDTA